MEVAARVGWLARGALYLVLALLAAQIPARGSTRKADKEGAFAAVAGSRFGSVLLVALAAGLVAFAAWRLWSAVRGSGEAAGRRAAWIASAVVSVAMAAVAMAMLAGGGGDDGHRHERSLTVRLLAAPGGRVVVGAIGVVVMAMAVGYLRKAMVERFRSDLDETAAPDAVVPLVRAVGVAGWIGRAVVWGLVGWFVLRAAVEHDPSEPVGLDETLRRVAAEPWGDALLWMTVAGFAAFALLCLAITRWPDADPES